MHKEFRDKTFAIIDTEGTWLKINNTNSKSLYITEVSGIIIHNLKIINGFSYRLKYDIRNITIYNKQSLKYIFKNFPNTFRDSIYNNDKNTISSDECRKFILNLKLKNGNPLPLYAKGNYIESIWLFYPESCDGQTYKPIKPIIKINELEDYNIRKYDTILNKDIIIKKYINIFNPLNIYDKFLFNVSNTELHYSLYECIIFGNEIINKYK